MTLMRYRPVTFGLIDRLLDDLAADGYGNVAPTPRATPEGFTIELALPGVPPDDIDLSVEGRTLTVTVDRRSDEERGQGSQQAGMSGTREWSWVLPEGTDADTIKADCEYGMLTIQIPKAESAKPRRIQVGASGGAKQVGPGADQQGRSKEPTAST